MSAQRMLSEPEAWRKIAERLDAATGSHHRFLCIEINETAPHRLRRRMRDRVKAHLGESYVAYTMPGEASVIGGEVSSVREGIAARILAALWLALEAEDEALSASRGRAE